MNAISRKDNLTFQSGSLELNTMIQPTRKKIPTDFVQEIQSHKDEPRASLQPTRKVAHAGLAQDMPANTFPLIPFTHMILLPKWVAYFQGTNADLFFRLHPIAEYLAKLTKLGVRCLVLDWEKDIQIDHKTMQLWPLHLKMFDLDQDNHFQISHVGKLDFLKHANWQAIMHKAKHMGRHLDIMEREYFHFHDAANYLRKENFDFAGGHLIDGLLQPSNQCQNLCASKEERCQPTEQMMDALLHYLEMLVMEIKKERLAEVKQELLERKLRRQADLASQTKRMSRTVEVGCGPFRRQVQQHYEMPYEPLYPQSSKGIKRKPAASPMGAHARLQYRRKIESTEMQAASLEFAGLAKQFRNIV